jgi:hypothetical protein
MRKPVLVIALLAAACGTHKAGGMSGPSLGDQVTLGPEIQSNDILEREPVTASAEVKHILIGWGELSDAYDGQMDPRAAKRTRAAADQLAVDLLGKVRGGQAIEPLMAEFSEDPGSATDGAAYPVTDDGRMVPEFTRLSLRLNLGEAGLVLSPYGWHIIQRVK